MGGFFQEFFSVSLQLPFGYLKEKGGKGKLYFLCVYQGDEGGITPT